MKKKYTDMQPHKKCIHPRTLMKMHKQKRKFSAKRLKFLIKEKRFLIDKEYVKQVGKNRYKYTTDENGVMTLVKYDVKGKIIE